MVRCARTDKIHESRTACGRTGLLKTRLFTCRYVHTVREVSPADGPRVSLDAGASFPCIAVREGRNSVTRHGEVRIGRATAAVCVPMMMAAGMPRNAPSTSAETPYRRFRLLAFRGGAEVSAVRELFRNPSLAKYLDESWTLELARMRRMRSGAEICGVPPPWPSNLRPLLFPAVSDAADQRVMLADGKQVHLSERVALYTRCDQKISTRRLRKRR
ncbi:uncharacterized protein LOC113004847 isoform X2 [Solenopsis invicta]|uniref:uncharacterized protein LOC113004847 isoform X2 n=1 Tax=Solenopsis invicta TaxID=13686 RepID=UPI00193DC1B7|nr:uncharacterized protein LOC113004847 isoform X2 [Solenopsis invicta]